MSDSRVALITGGGSGIGAATAVQLIERGYRVTVTGRGRDRLDAFAERLGRPKDLLLRAGDASEPDDVRAAVTSTVEQFGRLDVAIANAGYATFDDVGDGEPAKWRHMVLTNVLGPAVLICAALPELKRTRGRIVLVGSVAGVVYSPGNIYGATKWAVTGLAENTRRLVTEDHVGVTLINPGATETSFFDADGGLPDRALLSAEQLASCIVWSIGQPPGVDVNTITVRPIPSPL